MEKYVELAERIAKLEAENVHSVNQQVNFVGTLNGLIKNQEVLMKAIIQLRSDLDSFTNEDLDDVVLVPGGAGGAVLRRG